MRRVVLTSALVGAVLLTGGCAAQQYRSQPLGEVSYGQAFQAARDVFSQYFSVASADRDSGRIVARPKPVEAAPSRLLGASPARHLATLRVREKDGQVFAQVRVEIQRQDVGAFRAMQPVTADNELPGRTPAQDTAAVSADQNQAWQTTGRDEALERTVLNDLLQRLAKQP